MRQAPEVAWGNVLLDHLLTPPQNQTLLSGWVLKAKCSNDDRQFQIITCKAASQKAGASQQDTTSDGHKANQHQLMGSWAVVAPFIPKPSLLLLHLSGVGDLCSNEDK